MIRKFSVMLLAVVAIVGVEAQATLQDGLQVYVDFEDLSFDNQIVGGPTTHLFTGAARYAAGKVGSGSGDFQNTNGSSGVNDWAVAIGVAGDGFNGATAADGVYGTDNVDGFTFNLWMNTTSFADRSIFGNKNWTSGSNQGWNVVTTGNKTINWNSPGGVRWDVNYQPNGSNDGTWRMVTAVFDRATDTVRTYFDGVNLIDGTIRPAGATLWSSSAFVTLIGASGPGKYAGTALIDDVAIWDRPLTSLEVTDLYNGGDGLALVDVEVDCDVGDADCNGYIDLDDLIPAVGNFTGPCLETVDCFGDPGNGASIFNKVRAEGDVNDREAPVVGDLPLQSDGDIDLDDIIDMVGAFTGPPADSAGVVAASGGDGDAGNLGLPDLIYNSGTGEVTLNVDDIGGTLQVYNIKAGGGGILTTPTYTPILGGGAATDLTTEIGEFAFASVGIAPGGESIGNIFPTGMDLAALTAFVTGGTASPGFGGGTFTWELFVETGVPEPATVTMLGIGLFGLALVGYRRRRSA